MTTISPTCDVDESRKLALGAKDCAKAIGISERTLFSLTASNEIPHFRVRRRVLYSVDSLKEWIAARLASTE